jgi:hypothetical protein
MALGHPLTQLVHGSWAPSLDAEYNAGGWPWLKQVAHLLRRRNWPRLRLVTFSPLLSAMAPTVEHVRTPGRDQQVSTGIWRAAGPQRQGQVVSHVERAEGHPRQEVGGPPEL